MFPFLQNLRLLLVMLLFFGLGYPMLVTGIGQGLMKHKAQGSPLTENGRIIGYANIGQKFDKPGYFWGRPSAVGYNAAATGGSNKGPTNPAYLTEVRERIAALRAAHPDQPGPVPADLVTASGSGIDPDISLEAARYQAGRVASECKLSPEQILDLIDQQNTRPSGAFGPARVNVLSLNLALARLTKGQR